MPEDIQGQIERITFTSEDTGYTVARLKVKGRSGMVTIVGNIISPKPGDVLKLKGEWTNHPKYGEQFRVINYEIVVPSTVQGIEKYLGSGLIKGIGPVMAKRIVNKFGKDSLSIIENDIKKLSCIEGIGDKRIDMIGKAWADQREIRDVMLFLQSHGVSSGYATKIFRQYGRDSIKIVKDNPYKIAMDIFGIGFIIADGIARKLGFPMDSQLRIEAGLLYVLHQLAGDGHVYYPRHMLVDKCMEVLGSSNSEVINSSMNALVENEKIVIENIFPEEESENKEEAVYLTNYHSCETGIAEKFKALLREKLLFSSMESRMELDWVQEELSIHLAEKQAEAVKSALENKVMVITGGPGTGKTTIINAVIKVFSRMNVNIKLAAPTGRAAKRMNEATGYEAKTIHRLLSYSFKEGGFQADENNLLKCDLLIVDEASMIDTVLMFHLLKALPQHAVFIMVGDINQLPSVGAGNILADIISSGTVPSVELDEIFRQAKESRIIVNAHSINRGIIPSFESEGDNCDYYFIVKEDLNDVLSIILELVKVRIPGRFGFDPVDDIQVLSPMHRGIVGAENLNMELQKSLNKRADGIIRGNRNLQINDKVMQIRNNYDKDVFNGDTGRIKAINREEQEIYVSYDGRLVCYDFSEFDEIVLAYAISVHKSQGSEYPAVVIPIVTQHYLLLQRNLIYTAITRGKKLVVVVGTKKAMAMGVKNNRTNKRFTLLDRRLKFFNNR